MKDNHMHTLGGIYPALVTPMRDDQTLHASLIPRLVEFQIAAGVDGIWIAGASGEAELLSVEERRVMTEMVVEAVDGRVNVIVHVGSIAPTHSYELASHAQQCGVDAVASTPPHYYAPGPQTVVDHYRKLADVCDRPLFMYHLPACTHVPVTLPLAERLLEIPSMAGIKYSDHNLILMRQIKQLDPDRLTVLFGMDAVLLAALVMGADGGVGGSYNFMPEAYVKILALHREGRLAEAQRLQRETMDFGLGLRADLPPMSASKFALSFRGIDCGPPRPPHMVPAKDQQQRMRQCFEAHHAWLEGLAARNDG